MAMQGRVICMNHALERARLGVQVNAVGGLQAHYLSHTSCHVRADHRQSQLVVCCPLRAMVIVMVRQSELGQQEIRVKGPSALLPLPFLALAILGIRNRQVHCSSAFRHLLNALPV